MSRRVRTETLLRDALFWSRKREEPKEITIDVLVARVAKANNAHAALLVEVDQLRAEVEEYRAELRRTIKKAMRPR